MLHDGADFIDIGAYSSRPGADDVSENEELNRYPSLQKPIKQFPEAFFHRHFSFPSSSRST